MPGDYDGDSVMDLLVVSKTKKMSLFLGDKKSRYTNDLRKTNRNLFASLLRILISNLIKYKGDELYINANCLDQPFTAE